MAKRLSKDRTDRLSKWLASYPLVIVGSMKHKKKPRDIDIILVIPDHVFADIYLPIDLFYKEGKSGKWSEKHYTWSDDCIFLSYELQARLYTMKMVDCKIQAKTIFERDSQKNENFSD